MARFFNTQLVKPISTFVPEPLDLYQGKLEGLQKQKDAYRVGINGLNKQTDALSNDLPGVIQKKKEVEGKFESLRGINYNDPIERQKALKGVSEIQNEFSPFNLLGAADKKKKDFDELIGGISKTADKDPMKAAFLIDEAKRINLDPSRAIQIDPSTGIPVNREVIPPQDFEYKDLNDTLDARLKGVEFDQIATNYGLTKEQGHAALYNYMSGNTKERTGEKIYNSLKTSIYSDPNLQKSVEAEALYFYKDRSKADQLIEAALQSKVIGGKYKRVDQDVKYLQEDVEGAAAKKKQEDQLQTATHEAALGVMGEKAVADLSEVSKSEPNNSILSKIINFINPSHAAQGLINMYKVLVPSSAYTPEIINIEKRIASDSNVSGDKIDEVINEVGGKIKQEMASQQKSFRDEYGFGNPVIDQSYNIVDMFTGNKKVEETDDYKRAKEVTRSQMTPQVFDKLTSNDQFDAVKRAMGEYQSSSKLEHVIVPVGDDAIKRIDERNNQLVNVKGTPSQKTEQLINLGISTNGKFIDSQTNKDVKLEDILESGQIKYIGKLDNNNRFGPGVDYYQSADGKYYIGTPSVEDMKDNYQEWILNQTKNRFSKSFESPLIFDDSRDSRNFEADGVTPKKDIPSIKVQENINTGYNDITINLGQGKNIKTSNKLEDNVSKALIKNGIDPAALSEYDITRANITYKLREQGLSKEQVNTLGF